MPFDPNKMAGPNGVVIPPQFNELTSKIIGCAIEVHPLLGPGIREHHCERALLRELSLAGLRAETQVPFRVKYKGLDLGTQVIDLVVEGLVVVECKSVQAVSEVDQAQLLGYLRFTGLPVGLLINFHVPRLRDGITRRINYPPAPSSDVLRTDIRSNSVPSVPPQ